jgi:hypothetical protein
LSLSRSARGGPARATRKAVLLRRSPPRRSEPGPSSLGMVPAFRGTFHVQRDVPWKLRFQLALPAPLRGLAFLGGALYVVLFVVGTILLFSGAPDSSSAAEKIIRWYSDSGHRDQINGGWILIGLSLVFLLWFVAALRRAVSLIGGEGILTTLVGLYIAVAGAAVALTDGLRTMSDDTYQHRVFPELIHAADNVGWVMHATGALAPRRDDHRGLAGIHVGRNVADVGRLARGHRRHPVARLGRLLPAVPLPAVDPDRLDPDVPPQHTYRQNRLAQRALLSFARAARVALAKGIRRPRCCG